MSIGPQHITIAPSLLAADFGRLRQEVATTEAAGADWLHHDIVDGHFVQNLSFGPDVLAALPPHSSLPFDVHPMVSPVDPQPHRSPRHVRKAGNHAVVVSKPATSLETVAWALDLVDIILVMSVNLGFGGQSFLPSQLPNKALRRITDATGHLIDLMVDGAITLATVKAIAAEADILLAGFSMFHDDGYVQAVAGQRVDLLSADLGSIDPRRTNSLGDVA